MIAPRLFRAAAFGAAASIFCSLAACATGGRPATLAPAPEDSAEPAPPAELAIPTGRLPEEVAPTSYAIDLEIDPSQTDFAGEVQIAIQTSRELSRIWLHGHRIEALAAEVVPGAAGGSSITARYQEHNEEGVASLELGRPLPAGEATIRIRYRAPFDESLRGLYRVEAEGRAFAFTQFEATSARQAFPCFDEPRFKVPFTVSVVTPSEQQWVAFNTPKTGQELLDDGVRYRFETTRPLPTYLVALAVGELDERHGATLPPNEIRDRPLELRGLAVYGRGDRLAFALERTGRIVEELERYFGIAYPYRKLDVVAVPDFAAGAMENAGLITFRESLLLLDEGSPEWQRRGFAYVMAHELAHQWFGNYVTMEWWDDLWLNEAFATWMGWKITSEVFPEQRADLSLLSGVHHAMGSDSLVSARQIRQPIESHHDIASAFDSITYRKGSGVLAMFESYVGPEAFQGAIRSYLAEHAWGNAVGEDLVAAIEAAAAARGLPGVGAAMRSFLDQPGLPLVSTRLECDEGVGRVHLSQSRYLPVGSAGADSHARWSVPICLRAPSGRPARGARGAAATSSPGATQCVLLSEREASVELAGGCAPWVLPNADAAGYFRFAFPDDPAALRALTEAADSLRDVERAALADSVAGAFRASAIDFGAVLALAPRFAAMEPRSVSTTPMGALAFAREHVATEGPLRAALEARVQAIYGARGRALGLRPRAGESGEVALLRASVQSFLASDAADEAVRGELASRGVAAIHAGLGAESFGDLAAELHGLALRVALETADAALFETAEAAFRQSVDARIRGELLSALGAVRDPALRERALSLALDEEVRVNELVIPLSSAARSAEGREAVWTFLTTHFVELDARLDGGSARLIGLGAGFCSEEDAARVEGFFGARVESIRGGPRALASALESVRLCSALVEAHAEGIRAALATAPDAQSAARGGRGARRGRRR